MTGSEASEKPSLYDRLGGVYSIATVVEDLIDRVMVDPRLNANPRVDEAHHKVPPAGFKYLVTEMLCWAAGGPQRYSGRSMEESHRDMAITPGEWQAFMDDVQTTLDKFSVPAAEQAEVKALVAGRAILMVSVACARPAGKDSTAIWRPLARLPRTALCAGRTRALVRRIARLDFLAWKSRFQVVQVFRAATSQFFKISSVQVSPRAHDGSPSFRVRTRLRTGFAANPPRPGSKFSSVQVSPRAHDGSPSFRVRTRLRTRFAPAWALSTPGRGGYPEVSLRRGQLVNHPVSSSRAYRASHFHGPSGVRWVRTRLRTRFAPAWALRTPGRGGYPEVRAEVDLRGRAGLIRNQHVIHSIG